MIGSESHTDGNDSCKRDSRGVSIAITHALTIAITAVLITTLLIGSGQLLDEQEDRVAQEQFSEIGSDIVSHVNSLDRLDATGEQVNATVRPSYPAQVVGTPYTVTIVNITGDDSYPFATDHALVIRSNLLDQPMRYPIQTETPIAPDSTAGGGQQLICLAGGEIGLGTGCR